MINRVWPLILIFILFVSACVPQSPRSSRRTKKTTTSQGGNTPAEEPTFSSSSSVYWYSGAAIPGTITLNSNIETVIYIRGPKIHEFLDSNSNSLLQYCLVASFSHSDTVKNVRFRVVPIAVTNFNTNSLERLFRVDVPDEANNQTACDGSAAQYNSSGVLVSQIDSVLSPTSVGFDPTQLCSNTSCSGIISADNISLYTAPTSAADKLTQANLVTSNVLDLSSLGMRIDAQSQSTSQTSSCTTSGCRALGFDCCVNGQCVNDGEVKPNASTLFPTEYNQAMSELVTNPNAYFNYPNVFFICSNPPPVVATPTPFPDTTEEQEKRFAQLKLDYRCLENAKLDTPVYNAGECSDSNYDTKALCEAASKRWTYYCHVGSCSIDNKHSKTTCEAASGTWTEVFINGEKQNGTETAYVSVRNDVWDRCGCEADPFPTEPDAPQCPDFGLKATFDVNNNITEVICEIPQPLSEPTPFQNLSLSIPARSAPHRFFKAEDGSNVDDISTLNGTTPEILPEGTPFSYLDDIGKTDPQNGKFNMNAIVGQFSTKLNQAMPAKVIPVAFDQSYIISAITGYYTPCPQCANDSWMSAFSSSPASQMGTGLQSVGFSNNRAELQNNITNGNYEDTIFGRACWLPPTMLPFSHKKSVNVATQRANRLATQAAMYINGYQRDWYGFNKGALIGSFDGVNWFAIGKGRRITAKSNKLFLAMNSPFADLAEPTDIIVSITTDQGGIDSVPNYDYDPSVNLSHPTQNQGATCQYWHQCNVDADCVSKLGWEYTCVDTSEYRTHLPRFDINGDEKENDEISEATIFKMLVGQVPAGGSKRCVYRGAGAPCKKDYTTLTAGKKKMFTCAPNFYCADINSAEFNDELVRSPNLLEVILYGQEADVLGRPLNYVGALKGLDPEIISNIQYNFSIHTTETSDVGLCRPGKKLSIVSRVDQHIDKDSSRRTDYINQISSCDSSATGDDRVVTCPVFEMRSNQSTAKGDYLPDFSEADFTLMAHEQNSCGNEAKKDDGTGVYVNTFKEIELGTIQSLSGIVQPSLAQDACYRRPGSICHTDLDCTPNRLHGEQAIFFGPSAFGGTTAELEYWKETLICGQAEEKPFLTSDNFEEYDITKNRCCREIGNTLTMYTQDDSGIIPDNDDSHKGVLNTTKYPFNNPSSPTGVYSRYAIASAEETTVAQASPVAEKPAIVQGGIPKAYQWKTFNDTGQKTCCGGGWIREFADGTTDWSNTSRLSVNPVSFNCLNYRNELALERPDEVDLDNYQKDLDKICLAPGDGGCIQAAFADPSGFDIIVPGNDSNTTATMSTAPTEVPADGAPLIQARSTYVPYMPVPYPNAVPIDAVDTGAPYNYFKSAATYDAVSFYLPIYIGGLENISFTSPTYEIYFDFFDGNGANLGSTGPFSPTGGPCFGGGNPTSMTNAVCIEDDVSGLFKVLHANANNTQQAPPGGWEYGGIRIKFNTMNNTSYCFAGAADFDGDCENGGHSYDEEADPNDPTITNGEYDQRGMVAGNDLYYLTKFARLELLGIPQIFYEPVYCNSNREKLVEGIFDLSTQTRSAFEGKGTYNDFAFQYSSTPNGRFINAIYDETPDLNPDVSNLGEWVVMQDKVALNPVFSAHKFRCCAMLGNQVSSATRCCSGFAAKDQETKELVCKLPKNTNLNVYFNRFVSGEGAGETQPGGGLKDEDFIPETGEPKLSQAVYNKISALGKAYCEGEDVRRGAAFGYFLAQPNSGFYVQENQSIDDSRMYSIVDDTGDKDSGNETGMIQFQQGLRWDHHFYCL